MLNTDKVDIKLYDRTHDQIILLNEQPLGYEAMKIKLIELCQKVHKTWFEDDTYITIEKKGRLYQCVSYKWLVSQYIFDNTDKKQPFYFFLDLLFLYGAWLDSGKAPKKAIKDLAEKMQRLKDPDDLNLSADTKIKHILENAKKHINEENKNTLI